MPRPSTLEQKFIDTWRMLAPKDLQPIAEYPFAKPRRFRFDFAFPIERVAVELEGGVWSGGRHTRGAGYESDCEKYNLASLLGWRVLRFTSSMLERDPSACISQVKTLLSSSDTMQPYT